MKKEIYKEESCLRRKCEKDKRGDGLKRRDAVICEAEGKQ